MKYFAVLFLLVAFTCMGCGVTKEELQRFEVNLGSKVSSLEQRIEENSESIRVGGKIQADVGADLVDLRDNLQKLRGTTEQLEVKVSVLESKEQEPQIRLRDLSSSLNDVSSTLSDLSDRLAYLENSLGVKESAEGGEYHKEQVGSPEKGESASKEEAYASAYGMFKDGQYGTARDKFRAFLKAFPNSEYSDNAQFWIGECNYFQGKYEEAIIEYEAVIQNYPKGNKVPNALLKQALSFLKLGDTSSAKLLLQGVIKDYPNTTPAGIARKRLIGLK